MYIDLLIKIKNAEAAKLKVLKVRYSRMDAAIAELLRERGFLSRAEVKGRSYKKIIELETNPERPIHGIRFLSKPSRKVYGGYADLERVKGGFGIVVLTTPKGILEGSVARREKVGGQMLFELW